MRKVIYLIYKMKTDNNSRRETLSEKIRKSLRESEIPIYFYIILIGSMLVLSILKTNFALEIFYTELMGAAFTLFIIDVLLVRSKTRRWKRVRNDINYLIARTVNRLRDGISIHIFHHDPELKKNMSDNEAHQEIREQRNNLLQRLATMQGKELIEIIRQKEICTETNYIYFNEKADDIWAFLNIKYSEYFNPKIVSLLLELHIHLKDICGHMEQFLKANLFPEDKEYFESLGIKGISVSSLKIVKILNQLKEEGYSEVAPLS